MLKEILYYIGWLILAGAAVLFAYPEYIPYTYGRPLAILLVIVSAYIMKTNKPDN